MQQLQKIIDGCKAGRNRPQRKFYDQFSVPMYRVCYRYLKNELDTEDALTTGFVKAFDALSQQSFKSENHVFNWLKRIMINESLMMLRSQVKFSELDTELIDTNYQEDSVLSKMDAEDLFVLIQGLPKGYRAIFNMYVIDGYSHSEIAKELDISESTSRSQLAKARKTLRNQVEILQLR